MTDSTEPAGIPPVPPTAPTGLTPPPAPQTPPGYVPGPPPVVPGYAVPGYAAPGYAPQPYPARPTNGLAVAALVCGIVGLVASPFIVVIIVPILVSIAAVVMGHIALAQLKRTPGYGGRGMAVAGLILGYIPIAVTLLLIVLGIIALVAFGAFTIPFMAG